jgi:acyl carrier protein
MNKQQVLETVIEVVQAYAPQGMMLASDTPLLELQIIDSFSLVNVMLELESRLGISITPADLTFDHFHDCRLLANTLVERLL